LEVRRLSLRLGDRLVLQDVSIDFWPGHVHALIGPNGAGKSTLANTVMGLVGYTEFDGDILLDGQSTRSAWHHAGLAGTGSVRGFTRQ
jgi:Fe-S cluster assembly ATPase SufC